MSLSALSAASRFSIKWRTCTLVLIVGSNPIRSISRCHSGGVATKSVSLSSASEKLCPGPPKRWEEWQFYSVHVAETLVVMAHTPIRWFDTLACQVSLDTLEGVTRHHAFDDVVDNESDDFDARVFR